MRVKNRQQLLAVIAFGAVGLFAADKVILTPLADAWKSRSDQITEFRKEINEGGTLLSHADQFRSRWDQMRTNTLPKDASAAEQKLLKAFDGWSQSSRVVINSISPQMKKEDDNYMTLQCHVDASGSLGTLTRFLYDIGTDPIAQNMALKLDSVELTSRDGDGQQLTLGLQVSGLVLTPQEDKR